MLFASPHIVLELSIFMFPAFYVVRLCGLSPPHSHDIICQAYYGGIK